MRAWTLSLAFLVAASSGAAVSAQNAFLGIDARDAEGRGVLVVSVVEGGPAAKGGLVADDVILGWNGAEIEDLGSLAQKLATAKPDSVAFLDVRRGEQTQRMQVRLGTRPANPPEEVEEVVEEVEEVEEVQEGEESRPIRIRPAGATDRGWMGVMLEATDDGVRIQRVIEGSPAHKIGIQAGETIRSIDGKSVSTPDDILAILGSRKPGEQVQVGTIARRDSTELEYTYVFKLGERPADLEVPGIAEEIEEVEEPAEEQPAAEGGIAWHEDLGKAMEKAKAGKHPLMVKFTATWCGPCKMLDKQAFSDREVIDVSRHFVCVKVDVDEQPKVAEKYSVTGIPRVLFLNPQGEIVDEFLGLVPTKEVMKTMKGALEKTGGKGGKVAPPSATTRPAIRLVPVGESRESNDVNALRREVESLRKEVRELREMIRHLHGK